MAWRRRIDSPRDSEALPWLYSIARRVLANQRRSRDRLLRLRERLRRTSSPRELEDAQAARAELRDIVAALQRLREDDAEVLRLAAWEGLSTSQIAYVLGCSENAAAIRLHRARHRLKRILGEVEKEQGAAEHIPGEGKA